MKATVARTSILVAWLAISGWFVRYEAFPNFFTHALKGYQDLLSRGVLVQDSWMKVLFNGSPIGYSHTKVDVDESNATERYHMENQTLLRPVLMGTEQKISMSTEAVLDAMYYLRRFSLSVNSQSSSFSIRGRRLRGNEFDVATTTGATTQRSRVQIPDDAVIYSPMTDLAVSRLKPGQKMSFKAMDPLTLRPATVSVTALQKEQIEFRGEHMEATVLATEYMGVSVRSWIDADGKLLRQETPIGFIAETCEADEAMNAAFKAGGSKEDVLKAVSIRPNVSIRNPAKCVELRLRMSGVRFDSLKIESDRQVIESRKDSEVVMSVRPAAMPPASEGSGALADGFKQYLSSSPYIQADHPKMVSQARSIVKGETNAVRSAIALYQWVNKNIDKVPSPGVPSALEVLRTREGDCNEHTYLYVALARAAGLPAQVKVGITYSGGAFYYHAWPAVYVGRWVEMDPTLGQPLVDAAHIAFVEGEFADQLSVVQLVGRLRIEVLAQNYNDTD